VKPRRVLIWTDGGCKSGVGGWAAVILQRNPDGSIYVSPDGHEAYREISGSAQDTTNNRMELTAAVMALKTLKGRCTVRVHTDSRYLKKGITEWINGWKRYGWQTVAGRPVLNRDLWEELNFLAAKHEIKWKWIPGHAGIHLNERCDELASAEIAKMRLGIS
jgi:ribonuclease HI